MPQISIIIPIYNGERYVDALLSNLLEVNSDLGERMEIVMVDDGSKDGSWEKMCREAETCRQLKVVHQENGGIAAARNTGLQHACGRYVAFMDQDDIVAKGYGEFIDKLEKEHGEFLVSNHISGGVLKEKIMEDEVCDRQMVLALARHLLAYGLVPNDASVLRNPLLNLTSVWNCIFRREFLEENNIRFGAFVDYEDDWKIVTESLCYASRVCLVRDAFYSWTINPGSESHTPKYIPQLTEKQVKLVEWRADMLRKIGVPAAEVARFMAAPHHRRTLTVDGFCNACKQNYRSYRRDIQALKDSGYMVSTPEEVRLARNKKQRLLLTLLRYRQYALAYMLNKYLVRRGK